MYKLKKITGCHLRYLTGMVLILLSFSQSVYAVVNCKASTTYPPQTIVPGIAVSASYAGNDLPVGSIIQRQGITYSVPIGIYCDAAFDVPVAARITSTPSGAPITMTTDRGTGPVYPTNVPGVGVAVYTTSPISGSSQLIGVSPVLIGRGGVDGTLTSNTAGDGDIPSSSAGYVSFMLVKTGPIASGSVVNGSSFPSLIMEAQAKEGYTGLPIIMQNISFSGSSQFITRTCTTAANMTINLGSYDVINNFKSIGTTTKWTDASITLENCPQFTGYYSRGGVNLYSLDSNNPSEAIRTPNIFTVSVTSVNPVADNIININPGTDSATGVGIQLGYTPDNINANATSPSTIWSPGNTWNLTPDASGGTMKIPLAARYYQTNSTITPGKANANVIINIDYK
ncbi:fimbrial protein [Klebsiella aerogenes]